MSSRPAAAVRPGRHAGLPGASGGGDQPLDPLPDVTLITGDLVEGRPRRNTTICAGCSRRCACRSLLSPATTTPATCCARHSAATAICRRTGFCNTLSMITRVRLVALDTLVPGEGGGKLCDERLAWLDRIPSGGARAADPGVDAPPAVSRPASSGWTGPGCGTATGLQRSWLAIRRSSASCAATCTARSTAASPARSPARRRARRTRCARPAPSVDLAALHVRAGRLPAAPVARGQRPRHPYRRCSATGPAPSRCGPNPAFLISGQSPLATAASGIAARLAAAAASS